MCTTYFYVICRMYFHYLFQLQLYQIIMNIILRDCLKYKSTTLTLEKCKNHFIKNYQAYEKPIFINNSSLLYTSLFARTALIARDQLDIDAVFQKVKKSVLMKQKQLTPKSCSNLIQAFKFYLFQGDENAVLEKLTKYYEQNHLSFTQDQDLQFTESFMKIMINKAHTSVKFIPLKIKKTQHDEKSAIQNFYHLKSLKIHEKIHSINLTSQKQFSFQVRTGTKQSVKIKVMGIDEVLNKDQVSLLNYELTRQINKRDCIIIHSHFSQKIKGQVQYQDLQKFFTDRNYHKNIFYYHRPKNEHQKAFINKWMTILLKQPESQFNKKKIFMNFLSDKQRIQSISTYLSQNKMRECFGTACLLNFHQILYERYLKEYHIMETIKEVTKFQELGEEQYQKHNLKNQNPKLLFNKLKIQSPFQLISQVHEQFHHNFAQAQSIHDCISQGYAQNCQKFLILVSLEELKSLVPSLLQGKILGFNQHSEHKLAMISSMKDWFLEEDEETQRGKQLRGFYQKIIDQFELN